MNPNNEEHFEALLKKIADDPNCQILRTYRQHGRISTYEHCISVARESYRLARKFHLNINEPALIRGAFLHDYYLYDWHHSPHRLHGFHHPKIAMQNAIRDFKISALEAGIIRSHMWPLTLFAIPLSKEALLVCIADKICAFKETFHLH